ncbi:hypothetical protein NKG99_14385 [Mesorhizobium sp. M1409]|uniref:hypothetical protein n=1 Tax=Mesorhizobium sp. M1409 TaxID=2957100 RepID=UPI00333CB948
MRRVWYYHVGNKVTFGRFGPANATDALETLRDLSADPNTRLSVVYDDGLCMHLVIESFDDPRPKARLLTYASLSVLKPPASHRGLSFSVGRHSPVPRRRNEWAVSVDPFCAVSAEKP